MICEVIKCSGIDISQKRLTSKMLNNATLPSTYANVHYNKISEGVLEIQRKFNGYPLKIKNLNSGLNMTLFSHCSTFQKLDCLSLGILEQ